MPSYYLNDRHVATGVDAEGKKFAPKGRIGVLVNWRSHAQSHAGNGCCYWIDPHASAADEAKGVCKSIKAYFRRHVDAFRNWLEVDGGLTKTSIIDFEGLGGCSGDYRRTWSVEEPWWAWKHRTHLIAGFEECAAELTRAGDEVVSHLGCPDSCEWAKRLVDRDCCEARGQIWHVMNAAYAPLIRSGVRIGFDAGAAMSNDSVTYKVCSLFDAMGQPYQIEGSPAIAANHWYKRIVRLSWYEYNRRHVQNNANFYNVTHARFPLVHPDMRVWVGANSFGCQPTEKTYAGGDETKAWLEAIAKGTRELLATTPVIVLLDDVIVRFAIQMKKPLVEFVG